MPIDVTLAAALAVCGLVLLALVLALWQFQHTAGKTSRRYREMFRLSAEGIFVIRIDRLHRNIIIEEANGVAASALPPPWQGKPLVELIRGMSGCHRDFFTDLLDHLHDAVAQGGAVEYETSFRPLETDLPSACLIRLVPLAEEGAAGCVLGFMRDTSAAKQAETMFAARTRDFHALVEKSPDTIARYDRECHRIYANPAFERLASRVAQPNSTQPAEYCGTTYLEKLQQVLQSGLPDEMECTWTAPAGELMTSHVRLIPEHDEDGQTAGVLSIGRDITALKEIERHLRESRALLRELTARREAAEGHARKKIAREMHEEYGQRLSALRMSLALLHVRFGKEVAALGARIAEALQLLDGTIEHMRGMVSFIHPSVLNTGVAPVLEWLADDSMASTQIRYEVRVAKELATLDEAATGLVFKIVQAALSNVLRHAEAKNVLITLETHGGGCRLEVRDDGKGFDLDRSRRDSMGMVAMEEFSNMLGGEIVFLSAPGMGTVVEVYFPGMGASRAAPVETV